MKIKKAFVERSVKNTAVVDNFLASHRRCAVKIINDVSEIKKPKTVNFFAKDTLIFAKQKSRFLMHCPCSPGQVSCGYYVVDWGMGCPYKCSYCYLNYYQNVPGIMVYANLDDCFAELDELLKRKKCSLRIGTGEFMDSLALENELPSAKMFVEYFGEQKIALLELKTKSGNIKHLLSLKHMGKTVISWSVNPENIAKSDERGSAKLSERLNSAARAAENGYKVGFHFDPIVYFNGWEKAYESVVRGIFKSVKEESVAWVSLGALRFGHKLYGVHNRYYKTDILYAGELVSGLDGKYRYFRFVRERMFKRLIDYLSEHIELEKVYLCMESPQIWQDINEYCLNKYSQKLWQKESHLYCCNKAFYIAKI